MAHTRVETVARPVSNLVGSLQLRSPEELIDAHSAHQQQPQQNDDDQNTLWRGQGITPPNDADNPEWWPQTRGVPHYRPLNRHQDMSLRPYGANPAERVFTTMMLGGVWLHGVLRTGWYWAGSPGSNYFKYDVGGLY